MYEAYYYHHINHLVQNCAWLNITSYYATRDSLQSGTFKRRFINNSH